MRNKYFFDVPVYRLEREAYYRQRKQYIEDVLFPSNDPDVAKLRARERDDPYVNIVLRDHFERSFGGCWEYNEIVGYIRLHFLGSQVRGEYFGVRRKRIVKTRTKVLEYQTHKLAPEVNIRRPFSGREVLLAVREYLDDCRKELPSRHVDTSGLDALSPFIDWGALFSASRID